MIEFVVGSSDRDEATQHRYGDWQTLNHSPAPLVLAGSKINVIHTTRFCCRSREGEQEFGASASQATTRAQSTRSTTRRSSLEHYLPLFALSILDTYSLCPHFLALRHNVSLRIILLSLCVTHSTFLPFAPSVEVKPANMGAFWGMAPCLQSSHVWEEVILSTRGPHALRNCVAVLRGQCARYHAIYS